ncbi:hypothetical protein HU200_003409 [Digitaria exilis]|uniref:DUF1618 domain-containing protein n=1 Tax=Digitaria exilis TaxID=1010633 RepID=A0A835KYI0_9POAL|nr:hypothetical protein HU200_003409 [Digitaria exilis]
MATDHVSPIPTAIHGAAAGGEGGWMLLEAFAYFEDVKNTTTAISATPDGKHIQVTFYARAPPLLSRFCVHTPDGAAMHREPLVVATEDDLALIRVDSCTSGMYIHYYLYQAAGDDGSGKPSLTLLPRAPGKLHFNPKDIGLLRRRRPGATTGGGEYIVAGFILTPYDPPSCTLCLYDSKRADWKVYALSLSRQGQQEYGGKMQTLCHKNHKVVTIGGDAGTMAFVDLWRGMLFCDVLQLKPDAAIDLELEELEEAQQSKAIPLLGYVKLPDDLRRMAKRKGDARPLPYLFVCQPTVDLQDDARVLQFTVKMHRLHDQASVLAVDMVDKKILGVTPFFSRFAVINFTHVHSRLSKYLKNVDQVTHWAVLLDAGAQAGMALQGSSSKMKNEAQAQQHGGAFCIEDFDGFFVLEN